MLQGTKFIQDHTQRPDIRFCIVAVVFEYLWAHVVGGAGKGRRKVRGPLEDAGDPKVPKLDHIVFQEDVPMSMYMHIISIKLIKLQGMVPKVQLYTAVSCTAATVHTILGFGSRGVHQFF